MVINAGRRRGHELMLLASAVDAARSPQSAEESSRQTGPHSGSSSHDGIAGTGAPPRSRSVGDSDEHGTCACPVSGHAEALQITPIHVSP